MKTTILFITIAFCLQSSSFADDLIERRRVAQELVQQTGTPVNKDVYRQKAQKTLGVYIKGVQLDEASKAQFKKIVSEVTDALPMEIFEKILIESYAKTYSLKELKDIVAFFKTPSGKAYLKKGNQLNDENAIQIAQLSKAIRAAFMKKLHTEAPDLLNKIKKSRSSSK